MEGEGRYLMVLGFNETERDIFLRTFKRYIFFLVMLSKLWFGVSQSIIVYHKCLKTTFVGMELETLIGRSLLIPYT